MKTPLVSVIVPVLNEEKTIGACLESLLAQDLPKNEVEILVVDSSTDGSRSIIQSYPVHYLFEPIRGRARARNCALQKARGRFLAFTDGDCVVAPNWLKLLVDGFTDQRVGGCGGEFVFPTHGTWIEQTLFSGGESKRWCHESLIRGKPWPSLWTCNAAYGAHVLQRIGFFDESLSDCEDLDLGWRASLAGYELKYIPEAHVAHQGLSDLGEMWRRVRDLMTNYKWLCHKYSRLLPPSQQVPRMCHLLRHVGFYSAASLFWFLRDLRGRDWRMQLLYTLYALYVLAALLPVPGWRKKDWGQNAINILSEQNFPELKRVIWWRDQTSQVVIYRSQKPQFWQLNETASRLWCLIPEGKPLSEIIQLIAQEFEVSATEAERDIYEWVDLLRRENLLENGRIRHG